MDPRVDRRTVLKFVLGGVASLGSAGCLGSPDTTEPEQTPAGTVTTTTNTPTTTPAELIAKELVIDSRQCGHGDHAASVSFDADVTVDGVIVGKDGCQTAELRSVSYDGRTLDVVIETNRADDAGAVCTQCLTDIDYEARFEFQGDLPTHVAVTHRSMGESAVVVERDR